MKSEILDDKSKPNDRSTFALKLRIWNNRLRISMLGMNVLVVGGGIGIVGLIGIPKYLKN